MTPLRKRKTPRSEKYMEWVRSQQSAVSQNTQYVVAHHVRCFGWGGIGLKPSDFRTVPLTHEEHMELHRIGEREFWETNNVDPRTQICAQMLIYLRDVLFNPISEDEADEFAEMEFDELIEWLEDKIINLTRYQ